MAHVNVTDAELANILNQAASHERPVVSALEPTDQTPQRMPAHFPTSVSIVFEIRLPWMSVARLVAQVSVWISALVAILGVIYGSIGAVMSAGTMAGTKVMDSTTAGVLCVVALVAAFGGVALLLWMAQGTIPPDRSSR